MRRLALFAVAIQLCAQSQPTFYEAYADGKEMEAKSDWHGALAAYQRAAALRPAPAAQVFTYGNNLLRAYYPYTRIARCHLELGDLKAAQASLAKAQAAQEPAKEREALAHRLDLLSASRDAETTPSATPPSVSPPPPAPTVSVSPQEPAAVLRLPVIEPAPSAPSAPKPTPKAVAPDESKPEGASRASAPPAPAPAAPPASATSPTRAAESSTTTRWPWLLLLLPAVALFWRRRRPATPPSDFQEPERIGPYHIERLLGRGGFASTYLARHEGNDRRVALKRLHPYRFDDPEFLGRFRQEAALGARLSHPNIVALVDPGPPEGQPWIAMDFVEGESLAQRLKIGKPMLLAEVISIARELAAGISYAHGEGVVHRDLKPANIMLATDAMEAHAKIMDFGIARVMDAETLTTTYAFLGTPKYAAPEAQLKTAIGPASDWYAFGIILFEMLAGAPPFKGETPFEILERHRTQPLPNLREARPDAPEPLVALIEALCAKPPEARPSGEEILKRLESLG